jgi:ribonuclease E
MEARRERTPRPARREEIPIERIAVEMTPIEQDVYSLMGISPLVLINKEVKDPRSVIVSVKTTDGWERTMDEVIAPPPLVIAPPPEVIIIFPPEEVVVEAATPTIVKEEEGEEEPLGEPDMESETDTERPIIRRRRRRSSAKEN